jgi:competence protein ComEC
LEVKNNAIIVLTMKSPKFISALILALLLIVVSWLVEIDKGEDLFIYFLDVGQGDSALIDSPNGIQVLIDAGRNEKALEEIQKILPFWDRHIDILILTHGDLDHIGGFFEILKSYEVDQVLRSKTKVTSKYEEELLTIAEELGIEIKEISKGDKIILDQNANIYLDIYSPDFKIEDPSDRNENSLVFELIHGENEILFTGDATIETELELLQTFETQINSDILKVGHHGSKTSTSQLFLDKVSPNFSILSYGENPYGHPHVEVLEKLDKSGGEIFHTKDRATIVARSNGEELEVSYLSSVIPAKAGIQSYINIFKEWIPD